MLYLCDIRTEFKKDDYELYTETVYYIVKKDGKVELARVFKKPKITVEDKSVIKSQNTLFDEEEEICCTEKVDRKVYFEMQLFEGDLGKVKCCIRHSGRMRIETTNTTYI